MTSTPLKVTCIEAQKAPHTRLESYLGRHFDRQPRSARWINEANENKSALAEMLGLPHPNAALMFEAEEFELTSFIRDNLLYMLVGAEAKDSPPDTPYGWTDFDLDLGTLTYKGINGKRKKLIRQLRKASVDNRVPAFNSLCNILGCNPHSIEGTPFEKFWPKLGDIFKARNVIMITPDPIMLLGSGLFVHSGSCHLPEGEYEKGPFTYAYDEHTIAAFVFTSGEYKSLSHDALLTPYDWKRWSAGTSPCGRALGRTLYHVQDPRSYRIENSANFHPDSSSQVSGGKLAYFVQARAYGIMNDSLMKQARHVVEQRLREFKGIPVTPWKTVESTSVCVYSPSFTYNDSNHYSGNYIQVDPEDVSVGISVNDLPAMGLEEPPCPMCDGCFEDCGCIGSTSCCVNCDCSIDIDNGDYETCLDGDLYCLNCFWENFSMCDRCGAPHHNEDGGSVSSDNNEASWCENCIIQYATHCDECGKNIDDDSLNRTVEVESRHGLKNVCCSCLEDVGNLCDGCNQLFYTNIVSEHKGNYYCHACLTEREEEEVCTNS